MKNARLAKGMDAGIGVNTGINPASLEQPHPVEWMEMIITDDEDCQLLEIRKIPEPDSQMQLSDIEYLNRILHMA